MINIIVIAGWERSGSTIVANALGSTPGVVSVGEINNIWERGFGEDRICSCEQPFSRCELWQPVAHRAFGADAGTIAERAAAAIAPLGNLWLLRRELRPGGFRPSGEDAPYRALLDPLFRAIADHTGAHTIVDASKLPWHAAAVSGLDGFNVTVLHIVRDPRGVAFSHLKRVRYDTDDQQSIYMDRHGVVPSSLAWVYRNRLTERVWSDDPAYLRLRHEDFVAEPRATIRTIFAHAGSPDAAPEFVAPNEIVIRASHNVSGNPVRFRRGPVTLATDEQWRDRLPPSTTRLVNALTWPHRRHYGYR